MPYFSLYFFLILFVSTLQGGASENEHGTLIVTYQTQSKEDRLDLIRFWLVNSGNEKTLYPKKNEAVSSHCSTNERTVVISSLLPGRYQIEFLIPNKDQLFEKINPREILLEPNQTVKIDQMISLQTKIPLNESKKTLEIAQLVLNPLPHFRPLRRGYPIYSTPFPPPWFASPLQSRPMNSATFSLNSNKPMRWRLILRGQVIYSGVGSISNLYLPPGRQYILETEQIPGYTVLTAPRSPFDLVPNQTVNMEVFYQFQLPPKGLPPPSYPRPFSVSIPVPAAMPQEKTHIPPPSKGKLRVLTNSPQAIFTLKTDTESMIGQGEGYYHLFEDLIAGFYFLEFSNSDKKLTPLSFREQIEIIPDQIKEIKMQYQIQKLHHPPSSSPIPLDQPTIKTEKTASPIEETLLEVSYGDRKNIFYIGMYEVTNRQYADWINQALEQKKVRWDPAHPGHLLNGEGKLLCKTVEANPLSHLIIEGEPDRVIPIPGKKDHPVIEVTWQGAADYCKSKGYRLPTEAEWETAASLSFSKEGKEIKFLYGFGRNEIDRTWANYQDVPQTTTREHVLTTPVGFYNGQTTLPLRLNDHYAAKTHDAKSPIGAYDMSGNVWEWVADHPHDDTSPSSHLAKGGSYDSPAEAVKVSERRLHPSSYSDIYTGFRIAK